MILDFIPNKKLCFITGLSFVVAGFVIKVFVRPHFTSINFNPFGIVGGAPSLFYVTGFALLLLIGNWKHPLVVIAVTTIGSICYEIFQWVKSGYFDSVDVLFSITGGFIAFALVMVIHVYTNKQVS